MTIFLCSGIVGTSRGFWFLHAEDDQSYKQLADAERLDRLRDAGFDEDAERATPIVLRRFEILPGETLRSLVRRIFWGSTGLLREAVDRLEDEQFTPERLEHFGAVYTLPDLRQWLLLNARVAGRAVRTRL